MGTDATPMFSSMEPPLRPRVARVEQPRLARSIRAYERRKWLASVVAALPHGEADVRAGLEAGAFTLRYQPRLALGEMEVCEVEALVRWTRPDGELVTPLAFLPALERSGGVVPLGRWVMREACRQWAEWEAARPAGAPRLLMSVNVTRHEIAQPGMADDVDRALVGSGVPADALQIEVPTLDREGDRDVLRSLHELREVGATIAFEAPPDLHTTRWRDIPAQAVQVDRHWVQCLSNDPDAALALAGFVRRAHRAGVRVSATGVERQHQADHLVGLSVDRAQGHLFCPPCPPSELGWLDGDAADQVG